MTLIHAADLTGRRDAAFDATVYPLALIARKAPPPVGHRVHTSLGPADPALRACVAVSGSVPTAGAGIPQSRLGGGGPWILSTR